MSLTNLFKELIMKLLKYLLFMTGLLMWIEFTDIWVSYIGVIILGVWYMSTIYNKH